MLPEGTWVRALPLANQVRKEREVNSLVHRFPYLPHTLFPSALRLPPCLLSKSYPSISAEAHACILSSATMLRSQGFKKWTSLPTSKHTPTSLFHSPNDAAAPFLPLSGCLRSTDRMDSGSVFIGSVFSTACSRAPLRG